MWSFARKLVRVNNGSFWLNSRHNATSLPYVKIKQGELKGTLEKYISGGLFCSFKGIPYAKPPIGDLRFRAPESPESWSGVRDASEHGGICPQYDMISGEIDEGDEDCLFLNVYTPNIKGPLVPVMVWFHGGGFLSGSGDSPVYGPHYLVEENVVIVTVNYRLEALGFLCLDTEDVPGNAGMKDQVAALRWVKENISEFGGDPNNVTIFGESCGAASVTCHLVSPMSKGLFHKAIAQSGSCIHEWCISSNNIDRAFRVGKYLGTNSSDTGELVKFLRTVPREKLAKITINIMTEEEKFRGLPIYFTPTVEKQFPGSECFLPKHPTEYFKEGDFEKVPLMMGYNNAEGITLVKNNIKKANLINADFTRKIPRDIARAASPERLKEIATEFKKFYFGNGQIDKSTIKAICDLESDYNFIYGVLKFTSIMSRVSSSPVFLNRFCVDGEINLFKKLAALSNVKGACHADDLLYLFKSLPVSLQSNEYMTIKRMATMWTNFAKYGDPTPSINALIPLKWKPFTATKANFLNIDFELTLQENPDNDRFEFWEGIYKTLSGIHHNI